YGPGIGRGWGDPRAGYADLAGAAAAARGARWSSAVSPLKVPWNLHLRVPEDYVFYVCYSSERARANRATHRSSLYVAGAHREQQGKHVSRAMRGWPTGWPAIDSGQSRTPDDRLGHPPRSQGLALQPRCSIAPGLA